MNEDSMSKTGIDSSLTAGSGAVEGGHSPNSLHAPDANGRCPSVPVLGVPVSLINIETAVANILGYVKEKQERYICVRDVFGLMCAVKDPEIMSINRNAAMVTPDGMPLVWLSRWRSGFKTGRVFGRCLMQSGAGNRPAALFLRRQAGRGRSHDCKFAQEVSKAHRRGPVFAAIPAADSRGRSRGHRSHQPIGGTDCLGRDQHAQAGILDARPCRPD